VLDPGCVNVRVLVDQGTRGSVVGSGTMLQAGRTQVQFPMESLNISFYLIFPAAIWPLGSTQTLIEMSTRNLREGE
jgi:hypothetical protein